MKLSILYRFNYIFDSSYLAELNHNNKNTGQHDFPCMDFFS